MIQELREQSGVTIGQLAERLGVSRATVQSYVRASNAGTIQVDTLRRVVAALGFDLDITARPTPAPRSRSAFSKTYASSHLDELQGPETGTLTLPRSLWWQPNPSDGVFDLDVPAQVIDAYGAILGEGSTAEITSLINRTLLERYWDLIPVPLNARVEWERTNPGLGSHVHA